MELEAKQGVRNNSDNTSKNQLTSYEKDECNGQWMHATNENATKHSQAVKMMAEEVSNGLLLMKMPLNTHKL